MMEKGMTSEMDRIRAIHNSGFRFVFAITGGGSGVIGDLLSVPGGSRSLLEGIVPYSEVSLRELLQRQPDQACSAQTAIDMAVVAYRRGLFLASRERETSPASENSTFPFSPETILGVGVTASLVSDRPKRGDHRIHLAIQSFDRLFRFSWTLTKGGRTRLEEERLTVELILQSLEEVIRRSSSDKKIANGTQTESIPLFQRESFNYPFTQKNGNSEKGSDDEKVLLPDDRFEGEGIHVAPPLARLLFGPSSNPIPTSDDSSDPLPVAIRWKEGKFHVIDLTSLPENLPKGIFPGSFNPIHRGHLRMVELGTARLEGPVDLELAVWNVDKPPIDYFGILRRLETIEKANPHLAVWLTRFPLFVQKATFFAPVTFLLGADTLRRLVDPRYYGDSETSRDMAILRIIDRGDRFLLFARREGGNLRFLSNLPISPDIARFCDEVPPELFVDDISSTSLRKNSDFIF